MSVTVVSPTELTLFVEHDAGTFEDKAYEGICNASVVHVHAQKHSSSRQFLYICAALCLLVHTGSFNIHVTYTDEYPDSAWQRVMDLNVRGVFNLTQKCAKMLEGAGTVHFAFLAKNPVSPWLVTATLLEGIPCTPVARRGFR